MAPLHASQGWRLRGVLELPVEFRRDTSESRKHLAHRVSRKGATTRRRSIRSCPQMTQMSADKFNSFIHLR
jgi:hypothetical protein